MSRAVWPAARRAGRRTATVVLAIVNAVSEFPRGLILLGCVLIAGAARLVRRAAIAASRAMAGLAVAALASPAPWC